MCKSGSAILIFYVLVVVDYFSLLCLLCLGAHGEDCDLSFEAPQGYNQVRVGTKHPGDGQERLADIKAMTMRHSVLPVDTQLLTAVIKLLLLLLLLFYGCTVWTQMCG